MRVLVTGGAGFIGSHVCEYYAKRKVSVIALDNLSRAKLLGTKKTNTLFNWNYIARFPFVKRVRGSVTDLNLMKRLTAEVDTVIHTAGQTAVTASVTNPVEDFATNALGTFNVLEAARQMKKPPSIVFCSTNKVYGENVNQIPIQSFRRRYAFRSLKNGIPETLGVDLCEHTPYGCSKLAADLYAQDYARLYGLKIGVFRMSCIYGTRQFGVEDQGWLAWFTIAAVTKKPVTIFGDGKQVRDILWVEDLVEAYDAFIKSKHRHVVVNTGGGTGNTLSLLELIDTLKTAGYPLKPKFAPWRPSDQKVFISDISGAKRLLNWRPKTSPAEGVGRIINWVGSNSSVFK